MSTQRTWSEADCYQLGLQRTFVKQEDWKGIVQNHLRTGDNTEKIMTFFNFIILTKFSLIYE